MANVQLAEKMIPTTTAKLWCGFPLTVAQNIIPMLGVATWKILNRLHSPKQNLEDLLLAKDVTNEKGLPNGKPFTIKTMSLSNKSVHRLRLRTRRRR
jgi:hypothetical protein